MSGLAGRLRRMKEQGTLQLHSGTSCNAGKSMAPNELLPGWRRIDKYVWQKTTRIPAVSSPVLERSPLLAAGGSARDFLYYDVETTGLSGGAGTIAFLVGFGNVDGKDLHIEQLFLTDYPGEYKFLELLLARFRDDAVYVSYNGKSFDSQILRSRFIMNGIRFSFPPQLDLLHPARRLWGSLLESCRLGSIEEHILDIPRINDISGAEVPDIYFQFLDTGDPVPLKAAFDHHLQDIVSLERLLVHIQRVCHRPQEAYADLFRLGRWFLKTGFAGWEPLLQRAVDEGSKKAGYLLGRQLKRRGDWRLAEALWQDMHKKWNDQRAALELAMLYEHKTKDLVAALELAAKMIAEAEGEKGKSNLPETLDRLLHRQRRLLQKMSRQSQT